MRIIAPLFTLIALSLCASLASAATIHLKNGDTLNAPIIAETNESVTLLHDSLGSVTINRSQISEILAEKKAGAPQADTLKSEEPAKPEDQGLLASGFMKDWSRELDIGLSGAEGNSQKFNLHAGFGADYSDDEDVWKFRTAYDSAQSDNETSQNQFFADLQKDWLRPDSPWFIYAQGRYDWDEFKDWDYRISGSGGVGYQFLKNDTWLVKGKAGLGGNQTFGGNDEKFSPEAILGLDADWKISDKESLSMGTTFYPNLRDSGEFRNISTFDWKISMDAALGIKIGLSNEYDSEAIGDTKENDFKYNASLVWGL